MAENTMTQFRTEGEKAFPVENKENDNSSASSTGEETGNDQTGASDQEKKGTEGKDGVAENFADHPRWKEREADWKNRYNEQEKRHLSDIEKLRSEMQALGTSVKGSKEASDNVPAWFGGDKEQWSEFQKWNEELVGKAKSAALSEISAKSEAEQKAVAEATSYMNEQVGMLESDKTINPKGESIDRNKLFKFVHENDLVDSQGRWNYKAGYLMMRSNVTTATTEATTERKKLAAATTSKNRSESKEAPFMTSADFRKQGARPW